ncbi:MAG: hypothetical protein V1875_01660 [Candidatus Altiarchaeota archaeon]
MLILCAALSTAVSAVSIGAGPGIIDFGKMIKGGYAEKVITVSTSGDEDLICKIEYVGDLKDWLSIDKGTEFNLPANSRIDLKAVLQPDANAANGKYEGGVYINAAPTSTITSGAGLTVGAGIKIKLITEITDEKITAHKLKRVIVSNTEIGYPIKFNTLIQNTGNIETKPELKIDIYDRGGNLVKTYAQSKDEIAPTVEKAISIEVPSDDLTVGQYTAKLTIGQDEQTFGFSILDKGTLALKGVLRSLELNKIWVETGETAKITAKVENTGEVPITDAKLNLEIYMIDETYQTEKLVKTMVGEESMNIATGQTAELTAYFSPTDPGRYTIQGTVSYQGKKTLPKATVLNVLEQPKNYLPYILAATIVIIGVIYWLTKKGEDGKVSRFKKIWGNYLEIK